MIEDLVLWDFRLDLFNWLFRHYWPLLLLPIILPNNFPITLNIKLLQGHNLLLIRLQNLINLRRQEPLLGINTTQTPHNILQLITIRHKLPRLLRPKSQRHPSIYRILQVLSVKLIRFHVTYLLEFLQ
jgi:hypothetical protein